MTYINTEKKDKIAYVTINRPKALNALNSEVLSELYETISELSREEDLRCVVLTGEGEKSFVAGADIGEMTNLNVTEAEAFAHRGHRTFSALEELACPVIAAVNGYALGGGLELALACDIRIASENARFSFPETGLGIIPGFGGTQRLAHLVGPGLASELIFTGRMIKAEEAKSVGLVSNVVPLADLMETATQMAETIASRSPIAIRKAKKLIAAAKDLSIQDGLAYEAAAFAGCFNTQDQEDAMNAFLNKETFTDFKNK